MFKSFPAIKFTVGEKKISYKNNRPDDRPENKGRGFLRLAVLIVIHQG